MTLAGRVGIVTGATGGIGRTIVARLAADGMHLVAAGRTSTWRPPAGSIYLAGEVTDEAYVKSLVEAASAEYGGLDVLVNAHGLDFHSELEATALAAARELLDVNVIGVLATMRYAIPAMVDRGGGVIVNVGSRLGTVAIPGQAVYGASKAAVAQLSRAAAIDLARRNIRVNCVAPGITNTEMITAWVRGQPDPVDFERTLVGGIPMGRMAAPEEIAGAVAFLVGNDATYITGAILPVDGGYTAQ